MHASTGEEVAAAVVDLVVLLLLTVGAYLVFGGLELTTSRWTSLLWFVIALGVATLIGGFAPMTLFGWTFGMLLAGIRIVDIESGRPPGWRQVLRRTSGLVPAGLLRDARRTAELSSADVESGTVVVQRQSLRRARRWQEHR